MRAIFDEGDARFLCIFDNNIFEDTTERRLQGLNQYIQQAKDAFDVFPNGYKDDVDHCDIFKYFKKHSIQYYIGKKTDRVNKMIEVFKNDAETIGNYIQTCELVNVSELFVNVANACSNAITLVKKGMEHRKLSGIFICNVSTNIIINWYI